MPSTSGKLHAVWGGPAGKEFTSHPAGRPTHRFHIHDVGGGPVVVNAHHGRTVRGRHHTLSASATIT